MYTLFLDRDGVINVRLPGDYVKSPEAFVPVPGLTEALQKLSRVFHRIVVVTNQSGIGRGLMQEEQLHGVHAVLRQWFEAAGAHLDGIYYCPHAPSEGCLCRKPGTGMPLQAQRDFPDINFSKSWMVGDSASDIAMGAALGMRTVLIAGKTDEEALLRAVEADFRYKDLQEFADECPNLNF